mmetsp:Transcript_26177/g.55237  ORF Transcript_26177/g.55237 Transcript_26177/m.55237 type:complete len:244 (-) Transcript_26177:157-888(-)
MWRKCNTRSLRSFRPLGLPNTIFLDPRVFQRLRCTEPLRRFPLQQRTDEILRRFANPIPIRGWEIKASSAYRVKNLIVRIPIERRIATKQDVSDHPNRPNITALGILPIQHLRSHIIRRPHLSIHNPRLHIIMTAQSKINNLNHCIFLLAAEQEILRLQIAVDNPLLIMAVRNGIQYAKDEFGGIPFREVSLIALRLFDDAIKEFSPRAQFRDEMEVLLVLVDLHQFDDVGVVAFFQKRHLTS